MSEDTHNTLPDPLVLMQQAKRGDEQAFAALYELYFTPVFRYVYFKVGSRQTAEDIAQTVFIRAYEARDRFQDRTTGSPLAYFFTIARHAVIDYWRKKKDALLEDSFHDPAAIRGTDPGPEDKARDRSLADTVRSAVQKLTAEQHEVILLKFMEGFSNQEIAALLGKSPEAVRQLQCRGLKALRHVSGLQQL